MRTAIASIAWRKLALPGLMAAAALAAASLRGATLPPAVATTDLAQLVPERFAGWQADRDAVLSPIQSDARAATPGTYAQTLERVYRGPEGEHIMLSIAYGDRQRGDRLQAHRPEYCYQAQGFAIRAVYDEFLPAADTKLPIRRLHAERQGRSEPVSYWLTVGDVAALPGWSRKLAQIRQALSGQIPDGLLVRVSSIDSAPGAAYREHDRFIAALLSSLDTTARSRLAGRTADSVTSTGSAT